MLFKEYFYSTNYGQAIIGDSIELLKKIPDESINLVLTSPPFALQRQKEYGNKSQDEYVEWLLNFTSEVKRVLKNDGSFVIDLGGAYQKGIPIRSLHNYRLLIEMCDRQNWSLAEEFFWYNPAKLPSPIEWVNKKKIRVKDAVNTVWWLCKSPFPKANVSNVLVEYSERMKKLLKNSKEFYTPKKRPSGHNIGEGFGNDNGGAIPSNLLQISNTESTSQYLRLCKEFEIKGHPARFPSKLPEFFIKFLTEPSDLVLDIFAGSNTTGQVAEQLNRKWIAFDNNHLYLLSSIFRFIEGKELRELYPLLLNSENSNINLKLSKNLFDEIKINNIV